MLAGPYGHPRSDAVRMREGGVHQGWKRVALLLDQNANRLLVAGAFSGVPVPLDARAECQFPQGHPSRPGQLAAAAADLTSASSGPHQAVAAPDSPRAPDPERGCWCGFNAFVQRFDALRYTPLHLPLATVELSAGVYRTGPRGHIFVGAHQQIRRLELHPWCVACADRTNASHLSSPTGIGAAAATHPSTLRDPVVLEPACRDHAYPGSLSWDTATALAAAQAQPVELCATTSDLAGRTLRALTHSTGDATSAGPGNPGPGRLRCQCDRVATLFRDYGLKHYLKQLLQPHGPGLDGVWPMRCRACGTTWSYHRACRSSCAHGSHDGTGTDLFATRTGR